MKAVACWITVCLCLVLGGRAFGQQGGGVSPEDVTKQAEKTLEAARQYGAQQKQEAERAIEAKLRDVSALIADLSAKAETAKGETRKKLDTQIAELKLKEAEARERLDQLKSSSAKAWEDVRSGVEKGIEDLKKAYEGAASRFK